MNASRYWLPVALLASLALTACQSSVPALLATPLTSLSSTPDYFFALQGSFQIAAVDAADQSLINEVKAEFISDLEAGREADYRRSPSFSIHLLAGSEGSYFTSPDFLQNSVESLLATLVIPQTSSTPLIFKGEFRADRFYFADPAQQLQLTTASKAYLLTADSSVTDYAIQTFKGEVQPAETASESAVDALIPTETSAAAVTETPVEPVAAAAVGQPAYGYHSGWMGPPPALMPGLPPQLGQPVNAVAIGQPVYGYSDWMAPHPALMPALPSPSGPAYTREGRMAVPAPAGRVGLTLPVAYPDGEGPYPAVTRAAVRKPLPLSGFVSRSPNFQQDPFAESTRLEAVPVHRPSRAAQPTRAWSKSIPAAVIEQP